LHPVRARHGRARAATPHGRLNSSCSCEVSSTSS
jgi:hypothetical protein